VGSTVSNRILNKLGAALVVAAVISQPLVPSQAANSGKSAAEAAAIINATPQVVWNALHEERNHDPDLGYSKVLSTTGNEHLLEQQFTGIPLLGKVIAVTKQREEPFSRIDYSLVRSDKFKSLEGSWVLTPLNNGKATKLELSSFLDVGVPFSSGFIKNATEKKLNRRIENVKRLAEREQARMAASIKEDL
jgi:hypothetical protein